MSPEQKVNILLVDDRPENLVALEAILEGLGQNLVQATSGAEALRCLLNQDFAVILLDVQMPDMDGFETATLIRQRQRSRHTPIIFLTAFNTSDKAVSQGYALGAVDYLFKPLEPEILKFKVAAFVDLYRKTAEVQRQAAQLHALNLELRKREELFRCVSACSPVGIFVTDTEGNCTYANSRYEAIYEVSRTDALGTGWVNAIHPEDKERVFTEWNAASQAGLEYETEFRILTPTGNERWVYVHSAPMHGDTGKVIGYVGTSEDMTSRRQAEAERIQLIREQTARQEAEAANRLKDEFLATLSHELRTPLNSILGWAKLLRQREFAADTTSRALETIERNAVLQGQLIEDILDISRIIRGKMRLNLAPVNLVSVIKAAVDTVRLQAEAKNIQLEYIIFPSVTEGRREQNFGSPSPFLVSGDANRLQQVLWNLLTNAIKFTPQGGRVEVRLSLISELNCTCSAVDSGHHDSPEQERICRLNHIYSEAGSSVLIEVRDTGVGIEPKFLPHVFDRFRQADGSLSRTHGGLGLGLAIVRHLVEMHSGSVYADSEGLGKGSVFTLQLPLLKTESSGGDEMTNASLMQHMA